MEKHWYDERYMSDAPTWFSSEEAHAWACGYAAAVRAYEEELAKNLAKETGQ